MKVLQVYKDYYPPVKGGIEGHINLLSMGLKKRGVQIEVLVSNTRNALEKIKVDGIPVTKVPQIGRFASAPLNATFPFWLRELGRNVDIIHFHFPNPTAEISSLLPGFSRSVVVTYHSDIVKQKRLREVYSPFLTRFLKRSQAIIATSRNYVHSSKVLSQFESKCRVIPLGIDIAKFDRRTGDNEKIRSIREKFSPSILFIGRFRYYKGLHVMIDAMHKIDASLLLIGTGPLDSNLRRQVAEAGLERKIHFLGELPDSEMIAYLHACDIFVLPSILRSEAFGIVQLEAMACGKPVICTEVNTGTSFVNRHRETGLVVRAGDPDALAQAANYLLAHPSICAKFGRAGRQRVMACFSVDRMADSVVTLYRQVLATRRQPVCTPAHIHLPSRSAPQKRKIRVLRIISRLNIGGPALHVQILTKGLDPGRFESFIVSGQISPQEGDMSYLFDELATKPIIISELQREISLGKDLRVFLEIYKLINRIKPDIVHTHTAKAGSGARTTVFFYNLIHGRRIQTVHTFHGHVFEGYFSNFKSLFFIHIERAIAHLTDVIIAISASQKAELVEKYSIAPAHKFRCIELGFDLDPFVHAAAHQGDFREKFNLPGKTVLVGIIGRLVPIKNHYLFLRAARILLDETPALPVRFLVVGDGELRQALEARCRVLGLTQHFIFSGWIRDVARVYADLNVLALTSVNEGTPVSIIEAMAAAVPVIATRVGGVQDLLGTPDCKPPKCGFALCRRGVLCNPDDARGFAAGLRFLVNAQNHEIKNCIQRARNFVLNKYSQVHLIRNIESLYDELVQQNGRHG